LEQELLNRLNLQAHPYSVEEEVNSRPLDQVSSEGLLNQLKQLEEAFLEVAVQPLPLAGQLPSRLPLTANSVNNLPRELPCLVDNSQQLSSSNSHNTKHLLTVLNHKAVLVSNHLGKSRISTPKKCFQTLMD